MAIECICDGCGRRTPAIAGAYGRWHKPAGWFQLAGRGRFLVACSRPCIERVAEKENVTRRVLQTGPGGNFSGVEGM